MWKKRRREEGGGDAISTSSLPFVHSFIRSFIPSFLRSYDPHSTQIAHPRADHTVPSTSSTPPPTASNMSNMSLTLHPRRSTPVLATRTTRSRVKQNTTVIRAASSSELVSRVRCLRFSVSPSLPLSVSPSLPLPLSLSPSPSPPPPLLTSSSTYRHSPRSIS